MTSSLAAVDLGVPWALYALVLLAFSAEAVTGFGATVITVTLGAQLLPLDQLLPLYVPANFVLSLLMVRSQHRQIDRPWLLGHLLPLVGLGMAAGLLLFRLVRPGPPLLIAYAALVLLLAVWELYRQNRQTKQEVGQGSPSGVAARALAGRPSGRAAAALVAGGFIHGIYGSGGPLLVWASSSRLTEKAKLRATLAATWAILSAVLMAQYASMGLLSPRSLLASASLLPMVGLAQLAGDRIYARVSETAFRRLVYWLLLAGAASLLVRTAYNGG